MARDLLGAGPFLVSAEFSMPRLAAFAVKSFDLLVVALIFTALT